MEKTTIVTDLGGVVLERGFQKLWNYIAENHGLTFEDVNAVFTKQYGAFFSGQMSVSEFWKGFETELRLSEGGEFWQSKLLDFFTPQPKVLELYDALRAKGHRVGLLSDEVTENWQELDRRHSLSPHFDFITISSEVGLYKPDPEIYKLALQTGGISAEQSIFIDDHERNLPPAQALGMKTILFEEADALEKELGSIISE